MYTAAVDEAMRVRMADALPNLFAAGAMMAATVLGRGYLAGLGLTGSVGWRHLAGGDRATPVSMRFAAGPAFDIMGAPLAKDVAALSLALTGNLSKNIEMDVGYSGIAGSGVSDHGIRAALTFRF